MEYLNKDEVLPAKLDLLSWQKSGLSYTSTGYGGKIPATIKVLKDNRWRRVYTMIYSNSGTNYILVKGIITVIQDYNIDLHSNNDNVSVKGAK